MAELRLEAVRKVYDNGVVAVAGASFEVADGELLVLVGPSGCGKSTLLRLIAGLEPITAGRLAIGGRAVNEVPPKDRDIAMVFQSYALYPHMTVAENLAFGLKLRGTPKAEVAARVARAADLLELGAVLERRPKQLSGGQRQRVALGRAIVREPAVFLLDEPLSNLDAKLRLHMRTEIAKLHQRLGTTMIYVTHDQIEAMTLGDRIAVMKGGEIQQIAPPMEVYREPANLFVAGFLGSPAMNVLRGALIHEWVPKAHAGRELLLGIRPEDVHWVRGEAQEPPGPQLTAQLEVIEPIGSEAFLHARFENTPLVARIPPHPLPKTGETITLSLDLGKAHWFDAGTEGRVG